MYVLRFDIVRFLRMTEKNVKIQPSKQAKYSTSSPFEYKRMLELDGKSFGYLSPYLNSGVLIRCHICKQWEAEIPDSKDVFKDFGWAVKSIWDYGEIIPCSDHRAVRNNGSELAKLCDSEFDLTDLDIKDAEQFSLESPTTRSGKKNGTRRKAKAVNSKGQACASTNTNSNTASTVQATSTKVFVPYKNKTTRSGRPSGQTLYDLYIVQDLTANAIAKRYGVSEGTVRGWIHESRN